MDEEKRCKDCEFKFIECYKKVLCEKTNTWNSELYSCDYYRKKVDST